jgi:hypothetical protein
LVADVVTVVDASGILPDQSTDVTDTVLIGENVAFRTTDFLGNSLALSGTGINGFVTPRRVRWNTPPTTGRK